ncbi:MAG: hypothetical protein J6568_01330 [Snodgrassella sp.]|nr:hypothetical protein [Snodgrassella sp.]
MTANDSFRCNWLTFQSLKSAHNLAKVTTLCGDIVLFVLIYWNEGDDAYVNVSSKNKISSLRV